MCASQRIAVCILGLSLCGTLAGAQRQKPAADALEVMEASITDLQKALTEGRVTSRALVDAYLARIRAYDSRGPALTAIVVLNPSAAADAEGLDRERASGRVRGPLHGIPIIVKDNYDTAGLPTTAGSIALSGLVATSDSFQVKKLREAGAVILAKAHMHELASGITTIGSLGGQTRNPYDPDRNPGGSSGGTGAAIAASFAAAGMGSDTCGSIRIPAAQNNLVGLRPTKGLSSIGGILPLSVTQDVGGPLARSVTDLAIVLDATIGEDAADPATRLAANQSRPTFRNALNDGALRGTRLGLFLPLIGETPDDQEVARMIRTAADKMKELGATVVEVKAPEYDDWIRDTSVIALEFKEDLAAYLGKQKDPTVRSLQEIIDRGLYHAALETQFKTRLAAKNRDSEDYRTALSRRDALRENILKIMQEQNLDALVYSTVRRKPARIGDPQGGSTCQLSAHTGFPAITVPAGFTDDGLPIGVEFFGRPFADAQLVSLAYAFERATHHRRPPALTPPLTRNLSTPLSWEVDAQGTEVVPQVASKGKARVKFGFDPTTNGLSYSIALSGTGDDVLFANIHRAEAGKNGPVIAIVSGRPFRTLAGSTVLSPVDRKNLAEGKLYLNIATKAHRAGAFRAQLTVPSR